MKIKKIFLVFIALFLVGLMIGDLEARRGGRGGGRRISRSGVASRGSFKPRPTRVRRQPVRSTPARRPNRAVTNPKRTVNRKDRSARPTKQGFREEARRPKRDRATESKRQEAQKKIAENREDWQEWMDKRQEDRQEFIEEIQEERQEFIEDQIDRHHYHHHHGGFAAGVIVGGVVGGAVASSGTTTYVTTLPCSPEVVNINGAQYFRCGSDWYRRSYSGSQVVYIVVEPPR